MVHMFAKYDELAPRVDCCAASTRSSLLFVFVAQVLLNFGLVSLRVPCDGGDSCIWRRLFASSDALIRAYAAGGSTALRDFFVRMMLAILGHYSAGCFASSLPGSRLFFFTDGDTLWVTGPLFYMVLFVDFLLFVLFVVLGGTRAGSFQHFRSYTNLCASVPVLQMVLSVLTVWRHDRLLTRMSGRSLSLLDPGF